MMSMSQVSGISGTFLCDHLINHNKKKYLTNVILLGFFFVASIFVFLFDEKLDRHEHEKDAKEKELSTLKDDHKKVMGRYAHSKEGCSSDILPGCPGQCSGISACQPYRLCDNPRQC